MLKKESTLTNSDYHLFFPLVIFLKIKGKFMPTTIEEITINCSPEDVYELVANPQLQFKFNPNFREVRDHHGGQLQVGDTWTLVTEFMGREIVSNYTALEIEAPNYFVYESTSDSADIQSKWAFEPTDAGTRVIFHSEGTPKGFFASLALNLVKGKYDEFVRTVLQGLKTELEA